MKTPEISRINFFEANDVVQIFGENLTEGTKLYLWQAPRDAVGQSIPEGKSGYTDEQRANVLKWLKGYCANPEELDTVESSLPATPPEDAKVYAADNVFEHCIYFGDKEPGEPNTVPYSRTLGGTCIAWLENEAGISAPYIANRPQIWNTSYDTYCPGEHLMVYGDAFGEAIVEGAGRTFHKRAAIKNIETGEVFDLLPAMGTCYRFDAEKYVNEYDVPEGIPNGKYNLYVHSGTCGRFGWSAPYEITISDEYSLSRYFANKWTNPPSKRVMAPDCEVVVVSADDPSPFADYFEKIQGAIDSLENGGIVALSQGSFPISAPLNVKSGVALVGAGNSTVIKATTKKVYNGEMFLTSVFAKKPYGLKGWANDYKEYLSQFHNPGIAIRICDNAGVEDLKIELGNGINIGVIVADDKSENVQNNFINKVEIDSNGLNEYLDPNKPNTISAGILVAGRTKDMTIWSCNIKAYMPLYILPARHIYAKVVNNDLICRPRQLEETMLAGLRRSIISNNLFADGRRSFVTNQGCSYNWIYQNRSEGVGRAPGACEAYMSEHGDGEWIGKAKVVGNNYIDIESPYDIMSYSPNAPYADRFDSYERFLFITAGKGFGQYRKIIDVIEDGDKRKLILESDWDVLPDTDTSFVITFGNHHNLYVDNDANISNGNSQFVWGSGFENVYTGHRMLLSGGITTVARLHFENTKTGELHFYPDIFLARGDEIVDQKIVTGVIAFNRYQQLESRVSGNGIEIRAYPHFWDDDELWQGFGDCRGIFGNTVKGCFLEGTEDNYGVWFLNHSKRFQSAGVVISGGYNRILDNIIFGYKHPVILEDKCPGNIFSRNFFKEGQSEIGGVGTPIGRDIKK